MSKLDIANPEHERALRSALAVRIHGPLTDKAREDDPILKESGAAIIDACNLMRVAYAAIDDPAQAAELIRQLIKRAGVALNSPYPSEDYIELFTLSDSAVEVLHEDPDRLRKTWTVNSTKAIARLLALAPDAGHGPVLEALRGESCPA